MLAAALLLLQAAPAAAPAGPPQRFSILADPCASVSDGGKDIVVCGHPNAIGPRMPLRDDRGPPDHPVPANPDATGTGALAMEATPCAAHMGGCTVGFGEPIVAAALQAVGTGLKGLKDARQRHRDGDRRVAIDLDAPPAPIPAGAIRP